MEKKLVKQICEIVAEYTDVSTDEIKGKNRREDIIDARFMAIYICSQKLGIATCVLCEYFSMTKQNISYAVETFLDRIRKRPYLGMAYKGVTQELKDHSIIC